uniref:MTH1187 family thiamine-binding protein n=1 Tax=Fundidesulfovibrio putealis TaxID=270496 RepID=A0A7C4ABJ7_9BACT
MSVIAELSIFPIGAGGSLSPYVARAVKVIEESGLPYELGPMGTCIEGEWQEVMDVVGRCFEALRADQDRVYLTLKVDWRAGRAGGIKAKPRAVVQLMGKPQ